MRSLHFLAAFLAGVAISSVAALAQIPRINEDTEFRVKLLSPLSTEKNQKGDQILGQIVSPEQYSSYFMEGKVRSLKRGKTKSTLRFSFDFIETPDQSARMQVRSEIEYLVNSQGQANVDEEGNIIKKSNSATKKALLLTGIGAAAGAAIGGGQGAAWGAGAGAAVALVLIEFEGTKGTKVVFAPGSEFVMIVRI